MTCDTIDSIKLGYKVILGNKALTKKDDNYIVYIVRKYFLIQCFYYESK